MLKVLIRLVLQTSNQFMPEYSDIIWGGKLQRNGWTLNGSGYSLWVEMKNSCIRSLLRILVLLAILLWSLLCLHDITATAIDTDCKRLVWTTVSKKCCMYEGILNWRLTDVLISSLTDDWRSLTCVCVAHAWLYKKLNISLQVQYVACLFSKVCDG